MLTPKEKVTTTHLSYIYFFQYIPLKPSPLLLQLLSCIHSLTGNVAQALPQQYPFGCCREQTRLKVLALIGTALVCHSALHLHEVRSMKVFTTAAVHWTVTGFGLNSKHQKSFIFHITEQLRLEGTLQIIHSNLPAHGQGHLLTRLDCSGPPDSWQLKDFPDSFHAVIKWKSFNHSLIIIIIFFLHLTQLCSWLESF